MWTDLFISQLRFGTERNINLQIYFAEYISNIYISATLTNPAKAVHLVTDLASHSAKEQIKYTFTNLANLHNP